MRNSKFIVHEGTCTEKCPEGYQIQRSKERHEAISDLGLQQLNVNIYHCQLCHGKRCYQGNRDGIVGVNLLVAMVYVMLLLFIVRS